jgi:NADH-quinone oxidoreductase subunit M
MYQRVVFGPVTNQKLVGLKDMNAREIFILAPIFILIVWLGIYPTTFLKVSDRSTSKVVKMIYNPVKVNPTELGLNQSSK